MKQFIFITLFTSAWLMLHAQSIEQGNRHLYYQRYQSAANTFHQLLQKDPANAAAWYGLTKTYLLQDKIDKAHDSIQLAPEQIYSDPYFKVARGALLLEQHKKEEAGNYFSQALTQTKEKNPRILAAVADAHINSKEGDYTYAIQLLEKARKKDKRNPSLFVQTGDAYRRLLNGSEAYKAYQNATILDDKYAMAYYRLGEIFVAQKSPSMYMSFFQKALIADSNYTPALYRLYVHEFYHDPAQAMKYYKKYIANTDPSNDNQYDLADLLYLNKQYEQAIQKAKDILQAEGDSTRPKLYKLLSYSYAEKKDTATAIDYMKQYFAKEADSNLIAKDYTSLAEFYTTMSGQDSLVTVLYTKAAEIEKDSAALYSHYQKLADRAKAQKEYATEALWLGKYYTGNSRASNRDLFDWGLALYRAEDYPMADSVFGMYVSKYPEQSYGYYWQAKAKALQDKEMTEGLAIPVYEKLIEVLQKDTTASTYKNWMIEAYAYLAAYQANTEKNYQEAVNYFEKILAISPDNADAKRYIVILEKNLNPAKQEDTN